MAQARPSPTMRYIDQVLQPGEIIRHVTTVSRVTYLRGAATLFAAFVVWALAAASSSALIHLVGLVTAIALMLLGGWLLVRALWRRLNTELVITDRRVIY